MAQLRAKQIKLAAAGDLLVGGTGGNGAVLTKGTDGQILKIIAGGLAYANNAAQDIAFTPTGNIAATTVQDAIAEAATDAATALGTATTGLQTELDATQAGAGLSTAGAYVPYTGGQFITNATSLADADKKLDDQLKIVTAAAGAGTAGVQAELDLVETAVGLDANGNYAAISNPNYVTSGTVMGNLADLDTALKAVDTAYKAADAAEVTARGTAITAAIAQEVTDRNSAIAAETTRATGVESAMDTAYKAADTTLQGNIDAEVTRAEAAEGVLTTAVSDEASARAARDTAIATGAGLSGTGTYVADTNGHYTSTATSLFNADQLLDTKLSQVATDLAALSGGAGGSLSSLQAEVDAGEAAVGLNADGTLDAFAVDGGYTTGKTTFKAAVEALDVQVMVNTAGIVAANTRIDALGAAFNYVGTLDGGAAAGSAYDLATLPAGGKDAGDYYKVTTSGYFKVGSGTAFVANVGDGLVFNTAGGVDIIDNTNATVLAGTNIGVTGNADTGFTVSLAGTVPVANGGTGKVALEDVTSSNAAITLGAGATGSVVNAFAITFNPSAVKFADLAGVGTPADGKYLKWDATANAGAGGITYVTPGALGVTVKLDEDFAPTTGANVAVTLAHTPTGSVTAFINGVKLKVAGYTVSGSTVTLVDANNGYGIETGDTLQVSYSYSA